MNILNYFSRKAEKKREAKARIQFEENCKHINEIIDGHYQNIPIETAEESKKAFSRWHRKEAELFESIDSKFLSKLKKRMALGNFLKFQIDFFYEQDFFEEYPQASVLIQNIFTEPFPSLHDMPGYHLAQKIDLVFTLNSLQKEDVDNKYFVYIKHHFVNHDMIRGIIQFDIYKK